MDKTSKIYIAGHKGLVGSAIHRELIALGYTNIVVRSSAELDLTDTAATEQFFEQEKPEYVFLAAAKVGGIMANYTYRADFIYDNLRIQNNVVGASYTYKVKKLLFLGSSCIYPKMAPQPLTEDSLLTSELEYSNEPYAIAKIAGIKLTESFNIQYGTNYLSVMPTNLYGTNDNFDLEKSHVLPALIRRTYICTLLEKDDYAGVAKNLEVPFESKEQVLELVKKYGIEKTNESVVLKVWGTGTPYREFMHVDDMADACIFVMNNVNFSDLTKGMTEIRNAHLNVSTGSDITIKEIVDIIKELLDFKGVVAFDASKPDGTPRKLMNPEKLTKLGWTYKVELRDGLKRTIDWYKEQVLNA